MNHQEQAEVRVSHYHYLYVSKHSQCLHLLHNYGVVTLNYKNQFWHSAHENKLKNLSNTDSAGFFKMAEIERINFKNPHGTHPRHFIKTTTWNSIYCQLVNYALVLRCSKHNEVNPRCFRKLWLCSLGHTATNKKHLHTVRDSRKHIYNGKVKIII